MIQRKVCLLGDFAVGKTSLFNAFIYNRFAERYLSTVGVRIQRKQVVAAGQLVSLILWDIEGTRAVSDLKMSYLNGTTGVVLVCDLTRELTIAHCQEYATILRQLNPQICLTIAANKLDLITESHPSLVLVQELAQTIAAPLIITSASTGSGIEFLFQALAEELIRGNSRPEHAEP
jgi:small GTP-binding protein